MKNMIVDSIGNIDNDMVECVAALRQEKNSRSVWIKWGVLAACLCMVMVSVFTLPHLVNDPGMNSLVSDNEQKRAYSESEYGETFGQLLPTTILEGYTVDEIGIYGKNPAVLRATYYNEARDDLLIIQIAENAYFENVEYGVIQYGDTKADGTKSSQIYFESDGYTIMYLFNRSDIAEVVGFEDMVLSAPCYR